MIELPALSDKLVRRIRLCRRCRLHAMRKRAVPGRGDVPADIMFVGQGPGRSEDMRGVAFCGPTKRVLDAALEAAVVLADGHGQPKAFYANTVCCRPCDGRGGPNRDPTDEEAWACRRSLELIAREVLPSRVILLGRSAERHAKEMFPRATHLRHPAYLLRKGGTECPEFRRFAVGLSEVLQELEETKK